MKLASLPIPPSMNNAYPTNRYGRRFKSIEYVHWEREFNNWCLSHLDSVKEARREFAIPRPKSYVSIDCYFYFEYSRILCKTGIPKKVDASNFLKIIHDAIANMIDLDDSYFWYGSFHKMVSEHSDYCDIEMKWVDVR